MKVGLLWYDDNAGRDLAEKVSLAARRYQKKFGEAATVCLIHRLALGGNGKALMVDGVKVAAGQYVLRHHFWLGREERKKGRGKPWK